MVVLQRTRIVTAVKEIPALPVSWFVKRLKDQALYMLDLKHSDIKSISDQVIPHFTTDKVGSEKLLVEDSSIQQRKSNDSNEIEEVLREPELILKVDMSINGIREVTVNDIAVFPELRSLDLSLNAIQKFQGVGVAAKLVYLNLSYNNISELPNEALAECTNLQNLNLSVNKISSLIGFPNLPNLIKLNIRSNELKDLQGLQVLRSIRQIDASKNMLLTELALANNHLINVPDTISAISPLSRLKQLHLKGNLLSQTHTDFELQTIFAKDTAIELLDGVNIRPAKFQFRNLSHLQPPSPRGELKFQLKDAVKESMNEARQKKRNNTHESISFLHNKILYIDTLTTEETKSLTVSQIRAAAIAEPDGYLPLKGSTTSFEK